MQDLHINIHCGCTDMDIKETAQRYLAPSFDDDGDPHPVVEAVLDLTLDEAVDEPDDSWLDRSALRNHENLEDTRDAYQAAGHDIEDLNEVGKRAMTDWWLQHPDEPTGDTTTISVTYEAEDQTYTLDLTLLGFAHGQQQYFALDDEVETYLNDRITDLAEDNDTVYMEQNLPELLDVEADVDEMQDHHVLEGTFLDPDEREQDTDDDPDPPGEPDPYLKGLESVVRTVTQAMNERYDTPELDKSGAIFDALEDPDAIEDVQRTTYATDLPRELDIDRERVRFETLKDDIHTWAAETIESTDDSLYGELKHAAALAIDLESDHAIDTMYETFGKIDWGRSEYMAGVAMDALLDEETDEAAMVIGAGHQAHITEYLQELDRQTIEQYRDGSLNGVWLDGFPSENVTTESYPSEPSS